MSEEDKLKKLRVMRRQCKGTITRIDNFVSDPINLSSASVDILEARKEKLVSTLKDYEKVQMDILSIDEKDSEQVGEIEDKYYIVLAKINGALKNLTTKSTAECHNASTCKLPVIEIPFYDGHDFTKFKPFFDLFMAVIDQNSSLSDVQKLFYLRKYLQDDALSVIVNLPLENKSYKEAISLLKKRYDNKARLISNHIGVLLDIPVMQKGTAASIRTFVSQINQHLHALKNLGEPIDKWDMLLISILTRKLDQITNRAYQLDRDSDNMPSMATFIDYLEKRAIALEDSSQNKSTYYDGANNKNKSISYEGTYKALPKVSNVISKSLPPCRYCSNKDHQIYNCHIFKMLPALQRQSFVNDKNMCKICLNNHDGKCKFNFKCKLCKQGHNTLLHQESSSVKVNQAWNSDDSQPQVSTSGGESQTAVTKCVKNVSSGVLLPTIKLKVFNKSNNEEVVCRALLDTGSQASFVTSSVVAKLGLNAIIQPNNVVGFGNTPNKINEYVNLTVASCTNNVKLNLKCHVIDTITCKLPQRYINLDKFYIPKDMCLADDTFYKPDEISLLLGADVYFNILLQGCIRTENGPVLQNTIFGYIIAGNIPEKGIDETFDTVNNFVIANNEKLENVMEQFWLSEKLPEPTKPSNDEFVQAEQIFRESLCIKNNKFHVDMPLKYSMEDLNLGDSFSVAYNRFIMLEKRLQKDPVLLEQYKKFIRQYIELGHAKVVDIESYDLNGPVFILGHHPVIREASRSTPMRTVFDGSMRSRNGTSLNQVMLNGPVVQSELFDILILFRTYPYILTCDIQKMFRNVFINEHQRSLQNILWRDSPTEPINCLQLQTVTYGLRASTFLATRCLNELANRYKKSFPLASEAILQNTFVDDVLTGADDVETLQQLKSQIVELLKLGGFTLHKWCSNHVPVLIDIPVEHRQFEAIDVSQNETVKTLGLLLQVSSDKLSFSCPMVGEVDQLNTKRKILSYIGKMFDPLGLIGPVIVVAKLFMQELWSLRNLDWDSIIPKEQLLYWSKFINNLKQMGEIKIDRCVNDKLVSHVELVGYADASLKAFGSCLYLRLIMKNGTTKVNLLCSKSRVASLNKSHTIPQLELNSALLLAQLADRVSKILKHRVPHKVFLYSDSQIVLSWIKSKAVKSTVYVKNRVNQIVELTKDSNWYYVRSNLNPADLLSRGVEPQKLQDSQLWWHGSPDLKYINYVHNNSEEFNFDESMREIESSSELDSTYNIDDDNILCNTTNVESQDLLKRFSSLHKLQKVIGFIYRFYYNCLNKNNKITSSELSPKELRDSMLKIVRCAQAEHFVKELVLLSKNKPVTIGDQLAFLDKTGVIRALGRLEKAENLSYDKRHPAILPKNSFITHLIIETEHMRLMHAGARLVLGSLSQRYYLVNGIREVKKVVHKCVKCVCLKAQAAKQLMGDLPRERITQSRVYQHVGLDFCGPFNMKIARVRKPIITKGYIALFVCFAVKAIHLELVSDLTTEAFLACLNRFISRRGMPTNIFCDNAKTFKGACNKLKDLYNLHSSKSFRDGINKFCSENYIKFNWIPSYSPTFGGIWESGVKSVKHHFKRVVGNLCLTYEQFNTVIVQIEGILNSRPILSSISNDSNYITPGHFLIGTALTSYPEIDLTETSVNRVSFWKMCTKLKQDFWKTWSNDYLTQLQSRPKWKYQQPNLKEGDLVIVKGMNTSPLNWPMARIVKTFPGNDGNVRVADVKMNNKIYRRAITKLCPLPIM